MCLQQAATVELFLHTLLSFISSSSQLSDSLPHAEPGVLAVA